MVPKQKVAEKAEARENKNQGQSGTHGHSTIKGIPSSGRHAEVILHARKERLHGELIAGQQSTLNELASATACLGCHMKMGALGKEYLLYLPLSLFWTTMEGAQIPTLTIHHHLLTQKRPLGHQVPKQTTIDALTTEGHTLHDGMEDSRTNEAGLNHPRPHG